MSLSDVLAHQAKHGPKVAPFQSVACEREDKLRDSILAWCESQWPRWRCLWARSDVKSTIPVGCHDITVFAPQGRVVCFELKSKGGKPSIAQLAWAVELRLLGHPVKVIYSFDEFLSALNQPTNETKEI